ncbi:MAG TPA: histidine kinase dimerization/phospho-acceptor domain-containing protein, partial [Pyrinomonadaceae bacterium]|nr:histidine kinase dimerization/phospho-acceptor domain-containing protein [Pyrinomonadaceae bacterium]
MSGGSALLRRQITLITVLVATVSFLLISANLSQFTRSLVIALRDQAERVSLQTATEAEGAVVSAPNLPPQQAIRESQTARSFAEAVIRRGAPMTSLVIEDQTGATLIEEPARASANHPPPLENLSNSSVFSRLRQVLWGDSTQYEYSRTLIYHGQEFARVRLGVSIASIRKDVWQSLLTNLLLALAAIAAATFIAISSARLITAPLRALTSSIAQLEEVRDGAQAINKPEIKSTDIEAVADRIEQLSRQIAGDRSQLREARGGLQQILQNLQERLLLVSADERVMLASPGVDSLLGSAQPMEGRVLAEIVGPDHPLVALTKSALASHESSTRVTLPAINGSSPRPVVVSVQPIKDRGETVGALVSLHDKETVAKLESQLDYSQRLADFARITSGIAHEVKNPLNAMVIHLELLRSKLQRITPAADDARPQLEILTSEIKRLDRVVQTFLDFTRPPRINLRPLDVNQILEETLALAAPEAELGGLTVWRSFSPNLPKVAGDADLLKQAFLNIVINGFQAM